MGLVNSREDHWEQPSEKHHATLYYFAGRGLADQIRWMLAATDVPFTQKVISQREQFTRMSEAQLPFGQLPLLQIDGLELVQSQAIIRYLARRAELQGLTADEMVKCDMIAEAVRDLLSLVTSAPFKRKYYQPPLAIEDASPVTPATGVPAVAASSSTSTSLTTVTPAASNSARTVSIANTTPTSAAFPPIPPSPRTAGALTVLPPAPYDNSLQHDPSDPRWQEHLQTMRTKWSFIGQRFEAILRSNKMQLLAQQRHLGTKGSRFTGSVTPALANAPAAAVTTVTPVVATAASGSSQRKSNTPSIAAPAMDEVNYLVGSALTYADILVAHVTTWYVEECGPEIVADMPMLIALQNAVISLPGITRYIKSIHYFPLGDRLYIEQVSKVLGRKIN